MPFIITFLVKSISSRLLFLLRCFPSSLPASFSFFSLSFFSSAFFRIFVVISVDWNTYPSLQESMPNLTHSLDGITTIWLNISTLVSRVMLISVKKGFHKMSTGGIRCTGHLLWWWEYPTEHVWNGRRSTEFNSHSSSSLLGLYSAAINRIIPQSKNTYWIQIIEINKTIELSDSNRLWLLTR